MNESVKSIQIESENVSPNIQSDDNNSKSVDQSQTEFNQADTVKSVDSNQIEPDGACSSNDDKAGSSVASILIEKSKIFFHST